MVLSKLSPKLLFQGEELFSKDRGILLWDRSLDSSSMFLALVFSILVDSKAALGSHLRSTWTFKEFSTKEVHAMVHLKHNNGSHLCDSIVMKKFSFDVWLD